MIFYDRSKKSLWFCHLSLRHVYCLNSVGTIYLLRRKKMKIRMLLLAMMAVIVLTGCKTGVLKEQEIDVVTSASGAYHMESGMYTGEKLMALLKNPIGDISTFFAIATVNEDGSPNIASIMPHGLGEDVILLMDAGTATRDNLGRDKVARAILRTTDPAFKKGYDLYGNVGSRMLLKLIDDPEERNRLYKENEEEISKFRGMTIENCVFLKIVDVYPLG